MIGQTVIMYDHITYQALKCFVDFFFHISMQQSKSIHKIIVASARDIDMMSIFYFNSQSAVAQTFDIHSEYERFAY